MSTASPIGFFERYLSLWVALCIAAGIGLGSAFPALFQSLAGWEYGSVNFIVAVAKDDVADISGQCATSGTHEGELHNSSNWDQ